MFHRKYPFASDIQNVAVTVQGNNTDLVLASDNTKYLPADFMLDVRDGIVITISNRTFRLKRKSFQYWLSIYNAFLNTTTANLSSGGVYTIINNMFKVAPLITAAQAATLWYYALPAVMTASSIPNFPDDWTLIEFVRLKALEWTRGIDVGVAQIYMQKELARLKSSGLLNDAEYDTIPLENNQVVPNTVNRNSWMGPWM